MSKQVVPQPSRATGSHFYKYGSQVQWLEDLLLKHMLYVPLVSQLNDPADCKPLLKAPTRQDFVRFLMRQYLKEHPEASLDRRAEALSDIEEGVSLMGEAAILQDCRERLDRDAEERRVCSMSKRWDNLQMWAKYADDRRGYCIELLNDPSHPLFANTKEVLYDTSFRLDVTDPTHSQTAIWVFMKQRVWSGEEEVRAVIPSSYGGPYFRLTPNIATRIFLGEGMSKEDVARVQSWTTKRTPPIPTLRAVYAAPERTLTLRPS